MTDLVVIGAGPAGLLAALRAADLGARATVVASREFGGMAANDGPVPVRTLAHAGRLMRDARQLGQYGIYVSEPVLDYPQLLARVREVVADVRSLSSLRQQIDSSAARHGRGAARLRARPNRRRLRSGRGSASTDPRLVADRRSQAGRTNLRLERRSSSSRECPRRKRRSSRSRDRRSSGST
jgi:pyruvate/2-oxoglutarate dehydrogenase complex dihydrolipoamide dehydrogenase (E3) component